MTQDDLSHSLVDLCVGSYRGSRRKRDLETYSLSINLRGTVIDCNP
jgi:hypothetical protein